MTGTDQKRWWLVLFTVDSWSEFRQIKNSVMGFNKNKLSTVKKLKEGDYLIAYLTKVSAFVGILKVEGEFYLGTKKIWSDGEFPIRIPVSIISETPLSDAVSVHSLNSKLSIFPKERPHVWTSYVRSSPRRWKDSDGVIIQSEINQRTADQVSLPDFELPLKSKQVSKKNKRRSENLLVNRLINRTQQIKVEKKDSCLRKPEKILSSNMVTGHSVNFPIAETCLPTAVCLKTCYFAKGRTGSINSLTQQQRIYNYVISDPIKFAQIVALEYDKHQLSYLRWNGGGDLFPHSIAALNYLGKIRPDIILWVVTRIPEMAVQVDDLPNVYVHFSLDRHSFSRRKKFLSLKPKTKKYFFSYQCDKYEKPNPKDLEGISVVFFDTYKPTCDIEQFPQDIICPLNIRNDISNTCESCRRCFNGDAL